MLNIQHLTYLQNGVPLLQDVNLQVFVNQRVGLVGKNGCGKSTFFRLIRGEIQPDQGEIALQIGKTIAFVEQEIINSHQSALEFVLDGDVELRQLEKILACEVHDADWFDAQHRYEAIDGLRCAGAGCTIAKWIRVFKQYVRKFRQSIFWWMENALESGACIDASR